MKITTADGEEITSREREEKRIYETNAARMMTDILQGVMTNGTGVKLQLKNSVSAGKTGTTNDIKDGWFVGYTPYYTTAVWVGYDMPKALDNLAGNTYPGYIWKSFMDEIHKELPERDFVLYEDDRPVEIVDDALKEQELEAWNPLVTPTETVLPTIVPTALPTQIPEPTPSTGWIEYDDDWWDAQVGDGASSGYDDFYE